MEMIFCPLYSGSSGNCLFVQYGATRLLIDAGKSGKMIDEALDMIGVDGNTIDAILITHEHIDHISGAGVLCRKHKIPVYATEMTWNAMDAKVGKIPPELRRTFDTFSDFYTSRMLRAAGCSRALSMGTRTCSAGPAWTGRPIALRPVRVRLPAAVRRPSWTTRRPIAA